LHGESAEGDVRGDSRGRGKRPEDCESFRFTGGLVLEENELERDEKVDLEHTSMLISSLNAPSTPVGIFSISHVVARMITGNPLDFHPCLATAKHSLSTVDMAGSARDRHQLAGFSHGKTKEPPWPVSST
jgi:hypothetical protein